MHSSPSQNSPLILHSSSKRDRIHLSQTNRAINSICSPEIWRKLDFTNYTVYQQLINTPEAVKALSDNINRVQSLKWEFSSSLYYMNALWIYLNTTPSPLHQQIPTGALTHLTWGQLTASTDASLAPLPPMLRLTHYTSAYSAVNYNPEPIWSENYLLNRRVSHQHQLLWLLRLNRSTLTYLQPTTVPLLSPCLVRDICRTISHLDHLRILRLASPSPPTKFTLHILGTLFFSCPESLIEFTLGPTVNCFHRIMDLDPKEGDWDFDQGPLTPRRVPLPYLKTLEVPAMSSFSVYPVSDLGSILQHTPALQKLTIPTVRDPQFAEAIANIIGDHCPVIASLVVPSETDPHYCNNDAFLNIMKRIRSQQLENIHVADFFDQYSRDLSTASFMRHSDTPRKIEFSGCLQLQSSTHQAILTSCRALVSLRVVKDDRSISGQVALGLKDAIGTEWACTGIQKLAITVNLTPDGRDPAYLADSTTTTWIEEDHNHWRMLDKFYTQIGSLKELTFLDLKAAGLDP